MSGEGLTTDILLLLEKSETPSLSSTHIADALQIDHQRVVGAIKSIQSLGKLIEVEQQSEKKLSLTSEGDEVVELGSHEARTYRSVNKGEGSFQSDLMKCGEFTKVGFGKAMSAGWIILDKAAVGGPHVFRNVDAIVDVVSEKLKNLDSLTAKEASEFKKRKLIREVILSIFILRKGDEFSTTYEKPETELTAEMLASGTWRDTNFKSYNLSALGVVPSSGHLHPLLKVRAQYRQIFLEMGFTEMATNNYVESSFWNFDALFQPQQHPARDAHDTFFLEDPQHATEFPEEYLGRVKEVHSVGGFGSLGYAYDWKLGEARKNVLRTHTTAVSARMLYKLAQKKEFTPSKFFSIDRVFRNENLDATHLAEFHQIEGLVADYDLGLCHLMGIIQQFFFKLGIKNIRFKPAYNPYTEPSMEVFGFHPGLKKWVEIGNSGIFRPEMLLPMGFPKGVSVIAWGLSLERPTMIKYGINNIRKLFGHTVDLQMIYNDPICR